MYMCNTYSFEDAISYARANHFDGFLAVGGGSVMDTAKIANLMLCCPENELLDFVNAPIGKGQPVTKRLKPLICSERLDNKAAFKQLLVLLFLAHTHTHTHTHTHHTHTTHTTHTPTQSPPQQVQAVRLPVWLFLTTNHSKQKLVSTMQ